MEEFEPFKSKIILFCHIILSKNDPLDFSENLGDESEYFCDEKIFDIIINQANIVYFNTHIMEMRYIVEFICLQHIKERSETESLFTPYSFYEYQALCDYIERLKYLFISTWNVELPQYFERIIEWIMLRSEEFLNYEAHEIVSIDNSRKFLTDLMKAKIEIETQNLSKYIDAKIKTANNKMTIVSQKTYINLKRESEKLQKETNRSLQKSEKNMIQTSIAILGIFAAVVLTFNMGISFAAVALENFMQSDVYHYVLVIVLFGFIIGNVLFALFAYLRHIHISQSTDESAKTTQPSESIRKTIIGKIVIIFNITLIVILIVDVCCWGCGVVERRNNYIQEKFSIEKTSLNYNNEI